MSCRADSGFSLRDDRSVAGRGERGFTLIEVLVALVIVAFGMAALMSALSSSANTVSYMRDKTFAEWVALNQIATFRLQLTQGQTPQKGHTDGDIDFAGRSWHWRQDVLATAIQGLMRLDVKVRPKEAKGGEDDGWYVTVSGLTGDALAGPGTLVGALWDTAPANNSPGGNNPGKQLGSGTNNGLGTSSNTGLGNPSNTGLGSSGTTGLGSSGGSGNTGGTGNIGTPNTTTNGTGVNGSGNFGSPPPNTGGN